MAILQASIYPEVVTGTPSFLDIVALVDLDIININNLS